MGAPSGTVTFLFTDIERSTTMWEAAPEAMGPALRRHDEIIREAIRGHSGFIFATGGDGLAAAFARAGDGVAAAREAQDGLSAEAWPPAASIRVRMGLHTGEAEERDGDYFGPAVNRAARLMTAGHGGQVLLSATTAALTGRDDLVELGEHRFSGLEDPERVFQAGARMFPPLRALGAVPSSLPAERSAFVGRERELAAVAGLIRSERLVTLTGVGGVGKTRLALRVAAGLSGEFPGGIFVTELGSLVEAAVVPIAVASALGAPLSPGVDSTEVVCRFLAGRRALLVLDNCEHLIDAVAGLVDRILAVARRACVVTTSREALRVDGEVVWRVPPLTVEGSGAAGDAVILFEERARHGRPGFHPEPEHSATVVAICRQLDGIPLAIELAAARARVMSLRQIADHLDERFRLLTRSGRTAVARHQTLQGVVDWSYELLSTAEQALFDALGVFVGTFDRPAVQAVAELEEFEALDLIAQLVDKSMVEADPDQDRYRLLETLRHYARGRLVASDRLTPVRDRHAAWFISLAGEQASRMGASGQQVEALNRLDADYDNLRGALAYLLEEGRAEGAARLAHRLIGLFNIRHPAEGPEWLKRVLAIADELPIRTRARLLADVAYAAYNAGDHETRVSCAKEAVELQEDEAPGIAAFLLSDEMIDTGEWRSGIELARLAIKRAAETGDLSTQLVSAGNLARALALAGEEEEARSVIPEVVALAQQLANPALTASSSMQVSGAFLALGSLPESEAMAERALAYSNEGGPVVFCTTRCWYALVTADSPKARRAVREAIPVAREELGGFYQIQPLLCAIKVLAQAGRWGPAAQLLRAVHSYRNRSESSALTQNRDYNELLHDLSRRLDDPALAVERDEGAEWSLERALRVAEAHLTELLDEEPTRAAPPLGPRVARGAWPP